MRNLKVVVLFPWADKAWVNECADSKCPGSTVIAMNGLGGGRLGELTVAGKDEHLVGWCQDFDEESIPPVYPFSRFVLLTDNETSPELVAVHGSIVFARKSTSDEGGYRDITQADVRGINSRLLGTAMLTEAQLEAAHSKVEAEWFREKDKAAPYLRIYEDYLLHQNFLEQLEKILGREAA